MFGKILEYIHDLKLSAKFIGVLAVVFLSITLFDIKYNADKERDISQEAVKEWTGFFADNVRIALNTLMREDKMDLRFALFKEMTQELSGLDDVRVIRGPRTDELFMEVTEKEVIPRLLQIKDALSRKTSALEEEKALLSDQGEKEEIDERIEEAASDIEEVEAKIAEARQPKEVDLREQPRDELEWQVLKTGAPIYLFEGDKARVLIPYTTKREGCAEDDGCHKYAKEGDVLGAINLQFSVERINAKIAENNLQMAGFWLLRFIVILLLIGILTTAIITNNIHNMLGIFRRMADGDLGVRLTVKGRDEIGQLAAGFNKMAGSLEETKKELDKRLHEIYALYNVSKTLNASFETEQLLIQVIKDICTSIDIDRIIILLRADKGKGGSFVVASYVGFEEGEVADLDVALGVGFYGRIAAENKNVVVVSVDEDPEITAADVLSPDVNSIIAAPFSRRGEVMGLICAYKDRPAHFDETDLKLFDSVAEHLAVALENARLFEKTKRQAITDGLTGLYNKRYFIETLDKEIERARRSYHPISIFLMDMDNFKFYNDSHGHPAGDQLLRELAMIIRSSIRAIDIPCRYGGEEFVIILPETDKKGAMVIVQKLLEKIRSHPFLHHEKQPLGFVSTSIGLASFPEDATERDKLIQISDDALYAAKKAGKDRVVAA